VNSPPKVVHKLQFFFVFLFFFFFIFLELLLFILLSVFSLLLGNSDNF
jgi:hypothetical protein